MLLFSRCFSLTMFTIVLLTHCSSTFHSYSCQHKALLLSFHYAFTHYSKIFYSHHRYNHASPHQVDAGSVVSLLLRTPMDTPLRRDHDGLPWLSGPPPSGMITRLPLMAASGWLAWWLSVPFNDWCCLSRLPRWLCMMIVCGALCARDGRPDGRQWFTVDRLVRMWN
jgi:hypothetical protein